MFRTVSIASIFAVSAACAQAEGDPAKGEKVFKKCQACHVVANDAGEVLAGKNGKVGPNLYGIAGASAGAVEGFGYSKALKAAGDAGLVWDEETFVAYLADPTKYLRSYLDDGKARSAMSFRLKKASDAENLYAYLGGL